MWRFIKPITWNHHRAGWDYCIESLKRYETYCGVLFFSSITEQIKHNKECPKENWIGFMHSVPYQSDKTKEVYPNHWPTNRIFQNELWHQYSKKCHGIFCLSEYSKQDVLKYCPNINVEVVYHPVLFTNVLFDYKEFVKNKKIILLGQWLRNFEEFFNLQTNLEKIILDCGRTELIQKFLKDKFNKIKILNRVSNQEYDNIFLNHIVCLPLWDASANNSLLECIASNTPVLIPPLPAVKEYLGNEYPFYYNSLEEATVKSNSFELIEMTNLYLKNMDKTKFDFNYFADSVANSSIVKNSQILRSI